MKSTASVPMRCVSLGQLFHGAALGWPLESITCAGEHWFRVKCPAAADLLEFIAVVNPSDWEALPVTVMGPARAILLWQSCGVASSSSSSAPRAAEPPAGIWLRQQGPPRSLLQDCAARSFKGMTLAQIRKVCDHAGVALGQAVSMAEVLKVALTFVNGGPCGPAGHGGRL